MEDIMNRNITRRHFLGTASAGAAAWAMTAGLAVAARPASTEKLALLGGKPVRSEPFPSWPLIRENDEKTWTNVLKEGRWCRLGVDGYAKRFERSWAEMTGAKYCQVTSSGTSALLTSLNALDIGPGDEVLVPPYTFVATVNVVLMQRALPVFVDSDPETFQIDHQKIQAAITDRTRCILPVHLGGSAANLDVILETAGKHKLHVVEDACQAHLGEWRHRKLGTLGDLGCFSFQASKNLNSGEGGAILGSNQQLMERCEIFHNNGRGLTSGAFGYEHNGCNLRLSEFQAALLLEQLKRLEEQSRMREQNAKYLTVQLREIPGIAPARMYDGCTRNAYHLYMFRYDREPFAGLPRARFLEALKAEGIPCAGGYTPLNKEPFLANTLKSRAFQKIYSAKEISDYEARNHCPANDRLCEEAVWLFQTMLLASRSDMDQIAEAIRKIQKQATGLISS